ncbi:MAG: sigma-70 family RNA polymerase sigma factor [Lachnospiraceae bacterium]|nr:sigma-70 family RNA polymerase sigma factor [Lachnospiraceae bacterium]
MDDQSLLNLLQTDAEQGMRLAIRVYGPAVHKICASYLAGRPREELEEAEADVFVRLWKYRERIKLSETYPLRSYLFAIARNVSKDRLHRTRPDTLSLDAALEDGIEPEAPECTEEAATEGWLKDAVAASVAELDEPARSVFRERYYERRSVKEIAAHLDLPEKKVENILHRDRAKLRALLAEKGVTSYEEFEK